jgi:desulfoferrodoxin (superoxide reductase-like protein)
MSRAIVFFLVSLIFLTASSALSHPPSGIELEFDITEHELEIIVHHTVKDSSKHYVEMIVVKLNDEEIIEQKFRSQADSQAQRAEYVIIDARLGDEIEVMADCNISGRKKGLLVVEEKVEQGPE